MKLPLCRGALLLLFICSSSLLAKPSEPEFVGTIPVSGRVLSGQKHRCSPLFSVEYVGRPSVTYIALGMRVRQPGYRHPILRCDVRRARKIWSDPLIYAGLNEYLWFGPIPWRKNLYFADPRNTGGRKFYVDIYVRADDRQPGTNRHRHRPPPVRLIRLQPWAEV